MPVREADIKEYVQTTSSLLVPLIEEYGLDPMPLPNLRAGSQVVRCELLTSINCRLNCTVLNFISQVMRGLLTVSMALYREGMITFSIIFQ